MDKKHLKTKERIEKWLKIIDWKLTDCGCDFFYFTDNKGKETNLCWWHDRIEITDKFSMTIYFSIKSISFKKLKDGNAIAIQAKNNNDVFILLHSVK